MKQRIFTLIMMLALVIVAGSAFAQVGSKFNPYPGTTHSYTIPFQLLVDGSATLTSSDPVNAPISGQLPASLASIDHSTVSQVTFNIAFANAAASTTVTVSFQLNEGSCSNNIHLDIPVLAIPTLTLSIDEPTGDFCQAKVTTPLSNVAASTPTLAEPLLNTITFTVTPVVTASTAYTYTYTYGLPQSVAGFPTYSISYAGPGTPNYATGTISGADSQTPGVFTITFTTTTGQAPLTLTGLLGDGALTPTSGVTVLATYPTPTDAVTVRTLPSISPFQ